MLEILVVMHTLLGLAFHNVYDGHCIGQEMCISNTTTRVQLKDNDDFSQARRMGGVMEGMEDPSTMLLLCV